MLPNGSPLELKRSRTRSKITRTRRFGQVASFMIRPARPAFREKWLRDNSLLLQANCTVLRPICVIPCFPTSVRLGQHRKKIRSGK